MVHINMQYCAEKLKYVAEKYLIKCRKNTNVQKNIKYSAEINIKASAEINNVRI